MTADPAGMLAKIDWNAIAGRPAVPLATEEVRRRVAGRTVLVTGAGGSLGRPLATALAAAGAGRLVLYDHHESSLFRLRQSLLAASPVPSLRAVLGDVREARRVTRLFGEERPHLVYHLAAYKHVPWGEEDPEAFISANVLGARAVLDAAQAAGVEQIIYPSTDKAIDPPSLYGATKRLVEAMLLAASRGGPRCAIVRFVNVLGSQGSAPETFALQIAAGRPLTVTHPEMRRFWITPEHAMVLLLHAACLGDQAVIVAPDAGEEITVLEIARRLYRALRPAPPDVPEAADSAPPVTFTGLRPGERLTEPLVGPGEWLERTPLPGVLAVRGAAVPDPAAVAGALARVAEVVQAGAPPAVLRETLLSVCRALQRAGR